MEKSVVLAQTKDRLSKLESNGKNFKSPGVMRNLKRQIRNMSK